MREAIPPGLRVDTPVVFVVDDESPIPDTGRLPGHRRDWLEEWRPRRFPLLHTRRDRHEHQRATGERSMHRMQSIDPYWHTRLDVHADPPQTEETPHQH